MAQNPNLGVYVAERTTFQLTTFHVPCIHRVRSLQCKKSIADEDNTNVTHDIGVVVYSMGRFAVKIKLINP